MKIAQVSYDTQQESTGEGYNITTVFCQTKVTNVKRNNKGHLCYIDFNLPHVVVNYTANSTEVDSFKTLKMPAGRQYGHLELRQSAYNSAELRHQPTSILAFIYDTDIKM